MKSGIVMEINEKYAIVMEKNGSFEKVKAEQGWKQGDVVFFHKKSKRAVYQWIGAVAACFIIFMFSMFAYGFYYNDEIVISVDINPSIELVVNRWNRVIDAEAYNQEGEEILSKIKINNKSIDEAICLLLSNGLENYIEDNANILCTVQTESKKGTLGIKEKIRESFALCLKGFQDNYDLEIYGVDADLMKNAHAHRTTAGKYMTIMQLKEVMPEADIDEYSHCTITEIREEIERCNWNNNVKEEQQEEQNSNENDSKDNNAESIDENNTGNGNKGANGKGYQHHGHCD